MAWTFNIPYLANAALTNMPMSIAITAGSAADGTGGAPQAFMLIPAGQTYPCVCSWTGEAWDMYNAFGTPQGSVVPNITNDTPSLSTFACGANSGGILQVVCVGAPESRLTGNPPLPPGPYLVWQDTGGQWNPYLYENGPWTSLIGEPDGAAGSPMVDVAIGEGWNGTGQPALQVAYLFQNGQVYVSYQNDADGQWFFYAGASGDGLP
jgi:hypothetical protein